MFDYLLLAGGQAALGSLVEAALHPVDVLLGARRVTVLGEQDLPWG